MTPEKRHQFGSDICPVYSNPNQCQSKPECHFHNSPTHCAYYLYKHRLDIRIMEFFCPDCIDQGIYCTYRFAIIQLGGTQATVISGRRFDAKKKNLSLSNMFCILLNYLCIAVSFNFDINSLHPPFIHICISSKGLLSHNKTLWQSHIILLKGKPFLNGCK